MNVSQENSGTDPLHFEKTLLKAGYRFIAGIDEAGRGALCGPVVAAAVVLPEKIRIPKVDDSKKVRADIRSTLYNEIRKTAVSVGIGVCRADKIDRINILEATRVAMIRAVMKMKQPPDFLLIDAVTLPDISIPCLPLIKGDQRSHSISAASIIAKVTRDRIMDQWHRRFPEYGFISNKGYGTASHLKALRTIGPSPIHRKTFKGVYDCFTLFDMEGHDES